MTNVFETITDKTAAHVLANAFAASQVQDDVWSGLRFHNRMTGHNYSGYLTGSLFWADRVDNVDSLDMDVLRDQAHSYLETITGIAVTTTAQFAIGEGQEYAVDSSIWSISSVVGRPCPHTVTVRRISGDGRDVDTWCGWSIPVSHMTAMGV